MYKVGHCKMCGMCCRAIFLGQNMDEMKKWAEHDNADAKFVIENWTPISKEQAFEINPYLETWNEESKEKGSFYTCKLCADGKCLIHNQNKPRVCAAFPWYNERPREMSLYSPDCGYIDDMSQIPLEKNTPIPKDELKAE